MAATYLEINSINMSKVSYGKYQLLYVVAFLFNLFNPATLSPAAIAGSLLRRCSPQCQQPPKQSIERKASGRHESAVAPYLPCLRYSECKRPARYSFSTNTLTELARQRCQIIFRVSVEGYHDRLSSFLFHTTPIPGHDHRH